MGHVVRIARRQTAGEQQKRGQGIHHQQEEEVEDIDELYQEVAFGSIQGGTRRDSLHDNEHG